MSRGNDEQVKFLVSCIRNANNGKIDFAAVAQECDIVSKGAAAKRYERMMKIHGISTTLGSGRGAASPASGASGKSRQTNRTKKKPQSSGKDCGNNNAEDENDDDDDDDGENMHMKGESGSDGAASCDLKHENESGPETASRNPPYSEPADTDGSDDEMPHEEDTHNPGTVGAAD